MARVISMRKAINEALFQVMEEDPTVILLGEDIAGGEGSPGESDAWGGDMGITKGLQPRFGKERVMDTPISESAIMGTAVGAATCGLRPIAELMFVDFMGVCFDQIMNQAAKFRYMFGGKAETPVVIRTQIGAGYRGAAQHSQCLYPMFAHVPGIKCVIPSSAYDTKGLLIQAVRDNDPVIFFEHKFMYDQVSDDVPEEMYAVPFGEANIVREGGDVTIVAIAWMVHQAKAAAEILAGEGIECQIVDPRTISPLDEDTIIECVEETGRLVVVDEAYPRCNMGTDISALVAREAFGALKAPIQVVSPPHVPVPFAPELEDAFIPSPEKIAEAVRKTMNYK
ncbi:MAG: alpha-ketoacid dehydrogenase subunit beta [Alphaproteobacteria bacterium]|jgi:acetoin:2,6-dichlorophenolindophenol oxidoreductase subunit beta|nr:alpha-ketoacid dehydrogenase subunit beta [Rhodospirillaceae bacterium]MDG2481834.1 alpha-ketoacid dehydrogenase subunit beta [Alphaproteobacteria bacterium]MBT6202250.1 alpha-ketoacid dehydrogenase subunit beta [Rhodospirillaceae bacterium]MBT6511863.1 alpha-ketoacid dehydrogenase subunit beta [Rhodospirillaceae bacterium]MBT7615472.1 alpha-ketoacid dehydrogenase subunit beta [Rhodospirillaceae bacterium]